MIQLSARGFSAQEIAEIHDCADVTVYEWMDRFEAEGPEGLCDRKQEGRPPKIDKEAEAAFVVRILGQVPFGPRPAILQALQQRLEAVVETVATAGAETTVLVEDETELRCFPPLRKAWMPVGEQWSVEVPRQNLLFCLYGALDVRTGKTFAHPYPRGKSEHTKAFVRRVLDEVEGRVLLIWDHASWHVSKAVQKLIEAIDRLKVVLLPKLPPEANPVEDLWRELKGQVAPTSTGAWRR